MDEPVGGIPEQEIFPLLAPGVRAVLEKARPRGREGFNNAGPGAWHEIRLGCDRPLLIVGARGDAFLTAEGRTVTDPARAYGVSEDDLRRTLELMSGSSLYAWEEEFRQGFLTLPGGHRVGLCGRVVMRDGRPQTLREVSSLNIRIARDVPGAARPILPWVVDGGEPTSTLIFSPPGAGKTTVLRDLIRQFSRGRPDLDCPGRRVAVVDERSELAGIYRGRPRRDMGPRTDVLDGVPKAEGMIMLLRSMGPELLVTDELGRREDVAAVEEALRCGVRVITTAHAGGLEEVMARPGVGELVRQGAFARLILLDRGRVGMPAGIWDGAGRSLMSPPLAGLRSVNGMERTNEGACAAAGRAVPQRGYGS